MNPTIEVRRLSQEHVVTSSGLKLTSDMETYGNVKNVTEVNASAVKAVLTF